MALVVADLFKLVASWRNWEAEFAGLVCLEKEQRKVGQWKFIEVKR